MPYGRGGNDTPLTDEQKALAESCYFLAKKLVGPHIKARPSLEHELISEANYTLVKCARGYDPANGAAFTTYVHASIETQLRNLRHPDPQGFRRKKLEQAPKVYHAHELDRPEGCACQGGGGPDMNTGLDLGKPVRGEAPQPADVLADRAEAPARFKELLKKLPRKAAPLFRDRYAKGLSWEEMGAKRGVCRRAVQQAHHKAIARLRARLEKEGF